LRTENKYFHVFYIFRQALQLIENASPHQSQAIRDHLTDINRRWDDLNKAINNRQKDLEQALLRLGQFSWSGSAAPTRPWIP
jgi:hypothetical protein